MSNLTISDIVNKLTGSSTFKTAILHNSSNNPITTVSGLVTQLTSKDNNDGVYTKTDANIMFLKTGELATKVTEKAVAGTIRGAKNGDKSILVDELKKALVDTNAADYNRESQKTAKDFLSAKVQPSIGAVHM